AAAGRLTQQLTQAGEPRLRVARVNERRPAFRDFTQQGPWTLELRGWWIQLEGVQDDAHPEQKRVERVDILCPGGFFLHHRVSARPFASSDSRGTRIEYGRADPSGRTGAGREAHRRRASGESTSSRDVASGPVVRAAASQPRSRRPDAMA